MYVIVISEHTYKEQPTTNTNHLQTKLHTKLVVYELTPAYKQCAHCKHDGSVPRIQDSLAHDSLKSSLQYMQG